MATTPPSPVTLCADTLSIHVVQDAKHNLSLQRTDGDPVGLFVVVVKSILGTHTYHVLAENEQGAADQALCAAASGIEEENPLDCVETSVHRLPLVVRGWAGNIF